MKKVIFLIATSAIIFFNSSVFADNVSASPQAHPCKAIATACKSAGYVRDEKSQGKHIWKNCMKPILAGQTVSGVNIDPATAQACQAMKSKM